MREFRWLLLVAVPAVALADLPPEIERVLAAHKIPATDVSVLVEEVDASEPALSHLATESRSPASVMKTITTWSALEILGPAYTWPTEVYFLGDFDGRKLAGDLALKGYGDPYLVEEELWKLLRALRRSGLTEIDGDLVLDDGFFDVSDEPDPGEFDGQPYRTYNVVPSALMVNFKAVTFQFLADPAHGRVRVVTDPVLDNLVIRNRLELVDGACGGYNDGVEFNHANPDTLAEVVLEGKFSRRCNGYTLSRTALQHDTYVFGLFASLWKEIGGAFKGKLRKGPVPENGTPALVWQSHPLGEVVRSINKNSNNVMTRDLVYTLGAELGGAPGTREKGVAAIRLFLAQRGFDVSSLRMQNGAGLSRDERASAELLVDEQLGRRLARRVQEPVCARVHRVAVARRARRHDARPLRARGRVADAREDGPARSRLGARGLRARGEREDLRARGDHELRGRASRAGTGVRGGGRPLGRSPPVVVPPGAE